jgi:hypothetical protein
MIVKVPLIGVGLRCRPCVMCGRHFTTATPTRQVCNNPDCEKRYPAKKIKDACKVYRIQVGRNTRIFTPTKRHEIFVYDRKTGKIKKHKDGNIHLDRFIPLIATAGMVFLITRDTDSDTPPIFSKKTPIIDTPNLTPPDRDTPCTIDPERPGYFQIATSADITGIIKTNGNSLSIGTFLGTVDNTKNIFAMHNNPKLSEVEDVNLTPYSTIWAKTREGKITKIGNLVGIKTTYGGKTRSEAGEIFKVRVHIIAPLQTKLTYRVWGNADFTVLEVRAIDGAKVNKGEKLITMLKDNACVEFTIQGRSVGDIFVEVEPLELPQGWQKQTNEGFWWDYLQENWFDEWQVFSE